MPSHARCWSRHPLRFAKAKQQAGMSLTKTQKHQIHQHDDGGKAPPAELNENLQVQQVVAQF